MEYLILMTIAGSALCLAYVVWEKLSGRFLTQCMRYGALKFMLLVYVVPWVWLKDIYGYVVRWLLPIRVPAVIGHPVAMADIITEEEAYTTFDYQWKVLAIGIWVAVTLILVTRKSREYVRKRNDLLARSVEIKEGPVKETLEMLRKELHCLRRVRVYQTPYKGNTFTLGAIKPLIFLQEEYTDAQLYLILKHEMTHVIRKDLVMKLIMEFACCFHWFNYLVYALNKRLNEVCEQSCDERVLRGCTKEICQAYTRLLADNFSRNRKDTEERLNIPFQSGLDNGKDEIAERVNLIMKAQEIKSWKKRLAGGVFALMLVVNSFTAFAYPDVYHVEDSDTEFAESIVDGDAFWAHENREYEYNVNIVEVLYDEQFIDDEGNIYPIDSIDPHVFCIKHDIVPGKIQSHVKDDNGGCTVRTYKCTKCTICNTIWVGDWINTSSWAQCPH